MSYALVFLPTPNLFKWCQKIKMKSKSALNFYSINKYFPLALASWLTFPLNREVKKISKSPDEPFWDSEVNLEGELND